jgi:hypothetical protein
VSVVGVKNKETYGCGDPENFVSGSSASLPLYSEEVVSNILIPEINKPYSRHVVMRVCCGDALRNSYSRIFCEAEYDVLEQWVA